MRVTSGGVTRIFAGVIAFTMSGSSPAEKLLGASGAIAPGTFGCHSSLVGGTSVEGDFSALFVRALTTVNFDFSETVNVYAAAGCTGAVSSETVDLYAEAEFIPTATDSTGNIISASLEGGIVSVGSVGL